MTTISSHIQQMWTKSSLIFTNFHQMCNECATRVQRVCNTCTESGSQVFGVVLVMIGVNEGLVVYGVNALAIEIAATQAKPTSVG